MNEASASHSCVSPSGIALQRAANTHGKLSRTRRDWRLAAFGSSCTALGVACLMLVACSATPVRQAPNSAAAIASATSTAGEPAPPPPPEVSVAAAGSAPAPQITSPWVRLRQSFAMQGCDYNAAVRHWAHLYTQSANGFSASLNEAMPYLLVVLAQLEKRKLPGEFAFLPYIESTYTALASSGDRAAGIWQLMPDTAREAGLRITPEYDGRLDIAASTSAALDLIERYQERFGDWRIVDMAYNAGPYRLMQMIDDTRSDRTAGEIGKLRVHAGTHEHLAKLLAVACVISDPDHYKVELPTPDVDDELVLIELPAPVDLELAARLAGLDMARLRHLNPGFLRARMPANGPFHLLVPAARRQILEQTLGKLPQYVWRDWHAVTLKHEETINLFAGMTDLDASALATINEVAADATLAPGTRLLLPGRAALDSGLVEAVQVPASATPSSTGVVTVRAGDTLWNIARLNNVSVNDLVRWNGLQRTATLHLGQHLRLSAPAAVAGGQVTAVSAPAAN